MKRFPRQRLETSANAPVRALLWPAATSARVRLVFWPRGVWYSTYSHVTPSQEQRRSFHSGLDSARVQRLRRSGMTFNKPRGRDLLSIAFESRIRVLPQTTCSDLYAPPHPLTTKAPPEPSQMSEKPDDVSDSVDGHQSTAPSSSESPSPRPGTTAQLHVPEPNPLDPTSSAGNPIRLRRSAEGDTRSQSVIQARAAQERAVASKRAWHIAVVDPLPSRGYRLSCTARPQTGQATRERRSTSVSVSHSPKPPEETVLLVGRTAAPTEAQTTIERAAGEPAPVTTTRRREWTQGTETGANQAGRTTTSGMVLPQELLSPEAHTTLASAAAVMWTTATTRTEAAAGSAHETAARSPGVSVSTGEKAAPPIDNNATEGAVEVYQPPHRLHMKFVPPPVFFPQPHPQYYLPVEEGGMWPSTSSPVEAGAARTSPKTYASATTWSRARPSSVSPLLECVTFELPGRESSVTVRDTHSSDSNNTDNTMQNTTRRSDETMSTMSPSPRSVTRPPLPISLLLFPSKQRNHLQKSGDATRLPGCYTRTISALVPPSQADAGCAADPGSPSSSSSITTTTSIQQHYYLIPCLDPWLERREYGREEAQVEMITAYRNILFECAELFQSLTSPTKRAGGGGGASTVDILRVPALCMGQWRRAGGAYDENDDEVDDGDEGHPAGLSEEQEEVPMWLHEIGKLNQQALIKGFHRLPQECKEALLQNPAFTVEVYVPPVWLDHFVKTFLEEAWETPNSTLRPARTALYPGLAPPRSLLAMDGWVGKRKELTEAVESKGRSLLRGPHYQLDGKPIVEQEVWTQIRVFGGREEEKERLEKEKATAMAAAEKQPQQ